MSVEPEARIGFMREQTQLNFENSKLKDVEGMGGKERRREGGRMEGRTLRMISDPTAPRDMQPIRLPRAQA